MIRFLLNNELQTLDAVAPTLSVLEYLRTRVVLPGTKEGCAAGDCGACTVAVAELINGALHYKAVNACITPMGAIHGKQLIAVEHLRDGETLHPVQQAMVECHGSQCGFCTPGFVMSLFVWWQAAQQGLAGTDQHAVETALSGNLCRCTGYQPILRAAQRALASAGEDAFQRQRADVIAQLTTIKDGLPAELCKGSAQFLLPASSAELARLLLAFPQAQLVAGATDLGLEFTQQLKQPEVLISTSRIADMKTVIETQDRLQIGAAVTYSEMQPALESGFPAFARLLDRLGSLQIRNQGTLGGNVANASPIGDTPPVLLALNALVNVASAAGTRTVSIDQFFTGYRKTAMVPGEFILSVEFPKMQADELLKVYKISKRFDDDISALCLALWLKLDGATITDVRIGCGGMAATPARALQAEQALRGKQFGPAAVAAAQQALRQDFTPIDDVRASAEYRLGVAGNLLTRALLEWEGKVPVQLWAPSSVPVSANMSNGGASHA